MIQFLPCKAMPVRYMPCDATANIILCSHPHSDYPESTIHDTCDLGKQLEITQHEIPHECCTALLPLKSAAWDECFPSATTHCDSQPYKQRVAQTFNPCRPHLCCRCCPSGLSQKYLSPTRPHKDSN